MSEADERQSYSHYAKQMKRLKQAMSNRFYLEALRIAYEIIEDRTSSILKRVDMFHPQRHRLLGPKLEAISFLAQEKESMLHRYMSPELIDRIRIWEETVNALVCRPLEPELSEKELERIAMEGQMCAEQLSIKTTALNRAVGRDRQKSERKRTVQGK